MRKSLTISWWVFFKKIFTQDCNLLQYTGTLRVVNNKFPSNNTGAKILRK